MTGPVPHSASPPGARQVAVPDVKQWCAAKEQRPLDAAAVLARLEAILADFHRAGDHRLRAARVENRGAPTGIRSLRGKGSSWNSVMPVDLQLVHRGGIPACANY
jgi:hypothetical protein